VEGIRPGEPLRIEGDPVLPPARDARASREGGLRVVVHVLRGTARPEVEDVPPWLAGILLGGAPPVVAEEAPGGRPVLERAVLEELAGSRIRSLDDADVIMTALEQSTAGLHVGYSRRFKRRYLLAKEQILRGRLGDIVGMSARLYNSRAQVFQMLDRHAGATPVVDSLTYYIDLMGWYLPDNPVAEIWARGKGGVIREAGYDCDDVTYAVLTLADGALVNLSVSFALPEKYPSLGYCGRIELLGTQGVHIIDDDHLEQLLYTDRGIPHIYIPNHTVNMAFLGSSAPGDWAVGDFWGPLANETRSWLDHLATGRECALATAREARDNLQITLAIEEAVRSHKCVHLTRKER